MLGIAVAGADQNQDTGSKVTSSTIVAKSISKDGGIATYRGIVDIKASASGATNATECDALLMDDLSVSTTIPYIHVDNDTATIAHEASAGKIDEILLFYMMSRGIEEEKAMAMVVNGFFSDVVKKLIEMEME
jgi:Fe-S cluster assembly protein SufB